jgi:hypothetical protein
MMLKRFAQILGVVLILVGIVGLVLGERVWLGILNVDIVEDIVHLLTGGLLAYVGFGRTDLSMARNLVLALGVIYLVVGILGFVVPMMFGLIPDGYTIFDNLLHLALGVLSLVVAFAPGGAPANGWHLTGCKGTGRPSGSTGKIDRGGTYRSCASRLSPLRSGGPLSAPAFARARR